MSVACSATGTLYNDDLSLSDKYIIIYRPDHFCGILGTPDVIINDHLILKIKNNGYTKVVADPGEYTIEIKFSGIPGANVYKLIQVQKEYRYYLKYKIGCSIYGIINFPTTLQIMKYENALSELAHTHFQPPLIEHVEPVESTQ
ncbi:MAG: DUF2846 domain-containing protein [SAR324 cluster bacterium]|nr:DUF2846 domain-containing protein [SAR324 cluster bacterium]